MRGERAAVLTVWRRAWPASVLPVLALVAALAWPAAAPEEQRPPAQAPAELTVPRKAQPTPSQVPPPLLRTPAPKAVRATVRPQPATAPAQPSPKVVEEVTPTPAPTTSSPALQQCVEELLGGVSLDC